MSGETRSVVVRLSMDTAQAIAATAAFGTEMTAAMAAAERSSMSASRAVDNIGRTAGKAALAAGGALAFMTKAAMDWESEWAGVSKTVNGTSGQLDQLEGDLRGLARTMPATHKEIAAVAESAGQLGIATDDIAEFTRVMVMMGASTNLSADDAATAIAQFMNVMQTVPDQVDNIGNTIVDLGNKGASTESQITDMAQRLAGAGSLVGASEADVLGLASAMANLGIQSELGGGAMQRVFSIIYSGVKDGGDQLNGFAQLAGMSAQDFAQAWEADPVRAFDSMLRGLNGIQSSGGNVIETLADLGIKGTQNLQVILRLAGAGDMLTTSLDESARAWDQNSALLAEYEKRAATTASQAQVAWNNIKDAAIDGGNSMLPVVADVAHGVTQIAHAYSALPGPIRGGINGFLGTTAVLGGLVWAGSKVYSTVTSIRESLAALPGPAERSTKAMKGLAIAAGALAALTAVAGAIRAIQEATDDSVPSMDVLAQQMLRLKNGEVSNLGSEFDDLGESIRRITDKSFEEKFGDFMQTPFKGLVGEGGSLRQAHADINAIDEALASLVQQGGAEVGKDAFTSIANSAGLTSDQIDELRGLLPQYDSALAATATQEDLAAGSTDDHASAMAGASEETMTLVDATNQLASSMKKQRDAALGAFDAETQYRQALKEAAAQSRKNDAGIKGNSDAALENRQALSSLAAAWNSQSGAVRNNVARWREAKAQFITTATAMGVPKARAKELADQLLAIPKSVVTRMALENYGPAISAIDRIKAAVTSIPRTWSTRYYVTQVNAINKGPAPMPGEPNALGGFYPRAYAGGGIDRANAHMAEITGGGPVRIWSEPETGGEAYIPLANDGRRPRARQILSQTAYALGGEVSWRRGTSAPAGSGGHSGPVPIQGRIVLDADGRGGTLIGLMSGVARAEISADRDYENFKKRR